MAKEKISNKNLALAETLLGVVEKKPYLVQGSSITLENDDTYGLSSTEVMESLKRLEARDVLSFQDENDKYEDDFPDWMDLYFDKVKLGEFIEIAKDKLYKIPQNYKTKKELSFVVEALPELLKFKDIKEPVNFATGLKDEYKKIATWIADYSGLLKITYEDAPDVEWVKGLKTPQVYGTSQVPLKFSVVDAEGLKKLGNEIRELFTMPQAERVKLFLEKNKGLDWKCPKCKHWFGVKLEDGKQITSFLNDFYIHKFKACYDCRRKNYFTINPKGEIKFSTTRKKTLTEIKKEEEKQKEKTFNEMVEMSEKLRKQFEEKEALDKKE